MGRWVAALVVLATASACSARSEAPLPDGEDVEAALCLDLLVPLAATAEVNLFSVPPPQELARTVARALTADAFLLRAAGDARLADETERYAREIEETEPEDEPDLTVFLDDEADAEDIERVRTLLEDARGVAAFRFISRREAFERFHRQFADQPELVRDVGPEALPRSYEVEVSDPTSIEALRMLLAAENAVDQMRELPRLVREFPPLPPDLAETCTRVLESAVTP